MNICFGWCWYGTNMHRGNHLYSMGIPCSICFIFPSSFIQVLFVQFFTYINDKVTWRDELHLLFSSLFMSIINMYFHDLFFFFILLDTTICFFSDSVIYKLIRFNFSLFYFNRFCLYNFIRNNFNILRYILVILFKCIQIILN